MLDFSASATAATWSGIAAADLDTVARLAGRVPLAYTMSLATITITIAKGETAGTATITVIDDAEEDDDREPSCWAPRASNPGAHGAAADPSSASGGPAAPRCASSLPAWKNAH